MGKLLWFSSFALGSTNNVLMKPKMLLVGGWGWSATSPLIYTLQRSNKYAHFGYTKVFRYLEKNKKTKLTSLYQKVSNKTWENYKSEQLGTHRMNLPIDLEPLRDFPLDHFAKLVTGERTITKYIDFFLALHDHVITKGYKSVGDNHILKSNSMVLQDDLDILKSVFDVKILFIARDPVRRSFSQYLTKLDKDRQPRQLQFFDYVNIQKSYGSNAYVTVMEELWEGDGTAKKELSEFLDYPITNLWKNLYAPDRGHFVQYDKDVPCQSYAQDLFELTPQKYYEIKKQCQHIYDGWEDYYGSLPMYWGQPIEYS